jgi:hypothetical protein
MCAVSKRKLPELFRLLELFVKMNRERSEQTGLADPKKKSLRKEGIFNGVCRSSEEVIELFGEDVLRNGAH